MITKKIRVFLLLTCITLFQGCATLPSSEQMRAEIVGFQLPKQPSPGKALVYVVRPSGIGGLVRFNVFVDTQADEAEVGYTRGGQYIYFGVDPGSRKISSKAENWAEWTVKVNAGDVIYLQQEPAIGIIMARNNIFPIDDTQGKYLVKTLSLGTLIKPDGIKSAPQVQPVTQSSNPVSKNTLPNPAEKLEQLDELLKKGLITKKDYDIKKAEILKAL
ncbi:DUF2846 domain-containing protein [Polynucleobacter sp. MWH-UH24A]|uniref:DUF2846 domain-containing protein n=1 Tax=Polynucleobacter sp. MWH-UH24A TaxID=2689110 RepID=UPI001BFDBC1A|nr:DUF2846 domain-containing protein [Polynucleobacter sp. MWH-UH24A]